MLGENLNLEVVAEGIETCLQLAKLRSLGCRLGQGYLFARPLSAAEAEQILIDGLQPFADGESARNALFPEQSDAREPAH
jgi:EAL domain-containing protein (putative c-di-GMP-specific phosphodiesterase class I)